VTVTVTVVLTVVIIVRATVVVTVTVTIVVAVTVTIVVIVVTVTVVVTIVLTVVVIVVVTVTVVVVTVTAVNSDFPSQNASLLLRPPCCQHSHHSACATDWTAEESLVLLSAGRNKEILTLLRGLDSSEANQLVVLSYQRLHHRD
jgi:hypothetical protein